MKRDYGNARRNPFHSKNSTQELQQERKKNGSPQNPLRKSHNIKKDLIAEQKEAIQKTVFMRMSYDEKLTYCDRPEQIDGPSEKAWDEINEHLEDEGYKYCRAC